MNKLLLLLVTPLLFIGCSDDGNDTKIYTTSDIVGVWDSQVSNIPIEFLADGTLKGIQRYHNDEPIIYGTYTLENNILTTKAESYWSLTEKATILSISNGSMKLNGNLLLFTDLPDGSTETSKVKSFSNPICIKK